jgi:hypothetical protein
VVRQRVDLAEDFADRHGIKLVEGNERPIRRAARHQQPQYVEHPCSFARGGHADLNARRECERRDAVPPVAEDDVALHGPHQRILDGTIERPAACSHASQPSCFDDETLEPVEDRIAPFRRGQAIRCPVELGKGLGDRVEGESGPPCVEHRRCKLQWVYETDRPGPIRGEGHWFVVHADEGSVSTGAEDRARTGVGSGTVEHAPQEAPR